MDILSQQNTLLWISGSCIYQMQHPFLKAFAVHCWWSPNETFITTLFVPIFYISITILYYIFIFKLHVGRFSLHISVSVVGLNFTGRQKETTCLSFEYFCRITLKVTDTNADICVVLQIMTNLIKFKQNNGWQFLSSRGSYILGNLSKY